MKEYKYTLYGVDLAVASELIAYAIAQPEVQELCSNRPIIHWCNVGERLVNDMDRELGKTNIKLEV